MPIKNKIVIERTANPNFRKWHLNTQISECDGAESFHRSLKEAGESLVQIGGIGKKLVEALFGIDGIEGLNVSTYEIEIAKGTAFSWSDIQPEIVDILKTAFGEEEVEVQTLNPCWDNQEECPFSRLIRMVLTNNINGEPTDDESGKEEEKVDEIPDVGPVSDDEKKEEEKIEE